MSLPTLLDFLNGGHDVLKCLLLDDHKNGHQMSLPTLLDFLNSSPVHCWMIMKMANRCLCLPSVTFFLIAI